MNDLEIIFFVLKVVSVVDWEEIVKEYEKIYVCVYFELVCFLEFGFSVIGVIMCGVVVM